MIIQLPELHPAQLEIVESSARYKIITAGRRFGKTFVAAWIAIRAALQGKNVFWVGPTYQVAGRGWKILVRMVKPIPDNFVEIRKSDREIRFANGGVVAAKSADKPDNLRGEGLDLAVFDEAAFMDPYVWYEVVRPALADRKGSAIFISTPKGRNWYYDIYKMAEDAHKVATEAGETSRWAVFQYRSTDNPHVDPAEIEEACKELTDIQCRQEFYGEFVEMSSEIFPEEIFNFYDTQLDSEGVEIWKVNGKLMRPEMGQKIMTVDLAVTTKTTSDYTAFCSGVVTPDGIGCITDVVKFKAEGPDLPYMIKSYMERNGISIAYVESTAFQISVVQALIRQGVTVEELKADKDKVSRATYASIRMKNKQMLFPRGSTWFEEVKSSMGAFPDPKTHDDDVDAVSYFAVASTRVAGEPGMFQTLSLDEVHDLDELYGGVNEIVENYDTLGLRVLQMRGRGYSSPTVQED